jgi:hypothetical protein
MHNRGIRGEPRVDVDLLLRLAQAAVTISLPASDLFFRRSLR